MKNYIFVGNIIIKSITKRHLFVFLYVKQVICFVNNTLSCSVTVIMDNIQLLLICCINNNVYFLQQAISRDL